MDDRNLNPAPESDTEKGLTGEEMLNGQIVPEEALKAVTGGMRAFADSGG